MSLQMNQTAVGKRRLALRVRCWRGSRPRRPLLTRAVRRASALRQLAERSEAPKLLTENKLPNAAKATKCGKNETTQSLLPQGRPMVVREIEDRGTNATHSIAKVVLYLDADGIQGLLAQTVGQLETGSK